MSKDEMNAAVAAAVEADRKRQRDAVEAREIVRPLVGQVSIAMDSAEEIYKFALKQAGVKTDDVKELAALKGMTELAVRGAKPKGGSPSVALDAAARDLTDINAIFGPKPETKAA